MHQYHSFKYNWAKCSLKKFWRKFAFIVCKHKNKGLILQKNLHRWQKYYTTASRDKFWLCTIVLVLNNIIYLEEDFSWSGLGLAGPSPWVRNLHALAFHWIPITAPEKDKISTEISWHERNTWGSHFELVPRRLCCHFEGSSERSRYTPGFGRPPGRIWW